MRKYLFFAVCLTGFALFFSACSSTPRVTRVDADTQIDLSGQWNAADSQLVSREMIQDVLNRPWIADFTRRNGTQPRVIVGTVVNLSNEHIATATFIADLQRALINSGKVIFVASADARGEIREERLDQAIHARRDTAAPMGQETGADFMLQGRINTILDTVSGRRVIFYQVDLELINMRNNEKVWIGQKKIQKFIARNRFRA